jgi:hypothetical protein
MLISIYADLLEAKATIKRGTVAVPKMPRWCYVFDVPFAISDHFARESAELQISFAVTKTTTVGGLLFELRQCPTAFCCFCFWLQFDVRVPSAETSVSVNENKRLELLTKNVGIVHMAKFPSRLGWMSMKKQPFGRNESLAVKLRVLWNISFLIPRQAKFLDLG